MSVLIVLPPRQVTTGGNWIYASRIKKGMKEKGLDVQLITLDALTMDAIKQAGLVQTFNAYTTGRHVMPLAEAANKPLLVTMTGTDINEYLIQEETREETIRVIARASHLVTITYDAKRRLIDLLPALSRRVTAIPISVDLPFSQIDERASWHLREEAFLFLLPAGLRGVKNPLFPIRPLAKLHSECPRVQLGFVGPKMDETITRQVMAAVEQYDWVHYFGEIPHERMYGFYRGADVVMNTSKSEGLSHALLEAMSLGKPVIASRVNGNVEVIEHEREGLLYTDETEFYQAAKRLLLDSSLRMELGNNAKEKVLRSFSYEAEMDALHHTYLSILSLDQSDPIAVCR
jgi:glycosyltransferase involved in cell wall biosynthesis